MLYYSQTHVDIDTLFREFDETHSKLDALRVFYKYKDAILARFHYDAVIRMYLHHLFDQINYELVESPNTHDLYAVDILYRKAESYISFMKGLRQYDNFLLIHDFVYEDVLLIWRHNIMEMRERCISVFYEQKPLQYCITTALLSMIDESIIPFLYEIARSTDIDVSISAIVGLSLYKKSFSNWDKLLRGIPEFDELVAYAQSFDANEYSLDRLSKNIYMLFFYCRFHQLYGSTIKSSIPLYISALQNVSDSHVLNVRIVEAVEMILLRLQYKDLCSFSEEEVSQLILLFNLLPFDVTYDIITHWDIPKYYFVPLVVRLVENKNIKLGDSSNIAIILCNLGCEM